MTLVILIILLMSCQSLKNDNLEWSVFPDPTDVVTYNGEFVQMPLWYWLKITDYVIDTERNIEILKIQ